MNNTVSPNDADEDENPEVANDSQVEPSKGQTGSKSDETDLAREEKKDEPVQADRKPPVKQQEYKQTGPDIKSTDSSEVALIKGGVSVLNNITGGVVAVQQAKEAGRTDRHNSSAEAIASMTNNTVKELSKMASLNKHTVLSFGPASINVSTTDANLVSDMAQFRRAF